MGRRLRESGKNDKGKQKLSLPARVFGTAALAAGFALCPMKDAHAEDSTCNKEFKFLKLVDSEKKSDALSACFDGLEKQKVSISVEERCLCIELMDLIAKKDVEAADRNIEKFSKIAENPNFSIEVLEALKPIIENSEGFGVFSTLISINSILESPNYCPDVGKTIQLISQNPDKNSYTSLSAVSAILRNENYTHELIDIANNVLERYGERSYGPLQMIRYMIELKNVKVDIQGEDFEKRLFEVSDVFFSHYADNAYNTFVLFGLMSRKKSFTDEMFDAEYAEQISSAVKDVVVKGDDVMRMMWLPMLDGNSDISIFFYEIDLAEQTNANSEYALRLLFYSLSNENLLPEICTDHFIKDLSYIVNYIAGQNPGHEKELFFAFRKLLKSSDFTADMIDEKYAGILNTVINKVAESSKNPFDYESFLKNWGKKPKMPNKQFEEKYDETVEFILDKTDAHSKDVILAMNEVVTTPNFKPIMFDTIQKIVEVTTWKTIPWINPISLEKGTSKIATNAPKYLLDFDSFVTNEGDLPKKELEKALDRVIYIVENKGDLGIFDSMLSNSSFKIEMFDEENINRARSFVEEFNQTNGTNLDSDDFEILMNFSYALNVLEDDENLTKEEKIKGLYTEMNMLYFGRYAKKTLDQTAKYLDPDYTPKRPIAFVAFNKHDWNKAFYNDANEVSNLSRYYDIFAIETDSEDYFYKKAGEIKKKYGKIPALVLGGHGTKESINFGKGDEKGDIDVGDEEELEKLKSNFSDNLIVISVACSSGLGEGSIAAVLSKALDATVWAPNEDTCLEEIVVNKKNGSIKVNYCGDVTNKFVNGDMVMKNNKPYDKKKIPKTLPFEVEEINTAD